MATLDQLSTACSEAIRDADANGAVIAASFLRQQVPELFRMARHEAYDRELQPHPLPEIDSHG